MDQERERYRGLLLRHGADACSFQGLEGAFRFVSGRIAKNNPSDMNVKLPVATIGIRGTAVAGEVTEGTPDSPPSAEVILLGPGANNNADERAGRIIVGNAGSSVEISRAGFGTTVSGVQAPPTVPQLRRRWNA